MFVDLLQRAATALKAANLPYMIIGGQAVLLYGEPRMTKDVDITLGTDLDRLDEVLQCVEHIGLAPLVDPETFTRETLVLPCQDLSSSIRVDFIFSFSAYEQEALRRAQRVDIKGVAVTFASLEDLIIHKMIAGRPRDLEDVRTVLIRNPDADFSYVSYWLQAFSEALGPPFSEQLNTLRSDL